MDSQAPPPRQPFGLPLIDTSLAVCALEVWAARWFMAAGVGIGIVCAVVFLLLATPRYGAQMIVASASPLSNTADASAHPDDAFMQFSQLYAGPSVARIVLKDPRLVPKLRADLLFPFSSAPIEAKTTPEKLSLYLKKRVEMNQLGDTVMRTMNYTHPDPAFAVAFLARAHNAADNLIRARARASAAGRIAYLEDAVARTANADHRREMVALLMEQERIYMLTMMDEPFAARIIEPPSCAPRPVWPDKKAVLAVFILLGAGIGFVLRVWLRR